MSVIKPSLAKGTRDFSPIEMVKRNFIYDAIKSVFKKYGYAEIQTPSFENLSTLTGKYGDEGDKLIFKILNSGDYLKGFDIEHLVPKTSFDPISSAASVGTNLILVPKKKIKEIIKTKMAQ